MAYRLLRIRVARGVALQRNLRQSLTRVGRLLYSRSPKAQQLLFRMLTLALLRHAKSSWDDLQLDDFERPLNERGRRAAPVMGRVMAERSLKPDLILCSTSQRTRETLDLARAQFDAVGSLAEFEDGLYLASADELLARVRAIGTEAKTVLLIGHNPGMHGLALTLARTGDAKSLNRLEEKFPTAALAVFTFPQMSWSEVGPAGGRLESFTTPRDQG